MKKGNTNFTSIIHRDSILKNFIYLLGDNHHVPDLKVEYQRFCELNWKIRLMETANIYENCYPN